MGSENPPSSRSENSAAAQRAEERAYWLARHVLPHEAGLRVWLRRKYPGLDCDDVVQEAYAYFVAVGSVDAIRDPRTYLFSAARNIVRQTLRRQRVVPMVAIADTDWCNVAAPGPGPEFAASSREQLRLVLAAIARLPARCRMALVLRKLEGLSQREAAARMSVTEGTIEKQVARGLELLLKRLSEGDAGRAPAGASPRWRERDGKFGD